MASKILGLLGAFLLVIGGGVAGCTSETVKNDDYSISVNTSFKYQVNVDGIVVCLSGVKSVHGQYYGHKPDGKGSFYIATVILSNPNGVDKKIGTDRFTLVDKNDAEYKVNGAFDDSADVGHNSYGVMNLVYVVPSGAVPSFIEIVDNKDRKLIIDVPVHR